MVIKSALWIARSIFHLGLNRKCNALLNFIRRSNRAGMIKETIDWPTWWPCRRIIRIVSTRRSGRIVWINRRWPLGRPIRRTRVIDGISGK
jgi:hypothetical protein